ncbi:MAG: 50S ribosomal protein L3 [bacterium]
MIIETKKQKMSQVFNENGYVVPVTLLKPKDSLSEEELQKLVGQGVEIRGVSKGKGFTGVMKRWGFSGHPATHGHFAVQRKPGSIGAQGEGRVMPGKKMPGRAGGKKVFIKGLKVVGVENSVIVVSGPVPGHIGGVVELFVGK